MKIVILDSGALDPGDISWKEMEKFGELIRYDRTLKESVAERIGDAEIVFTNKTEITARAVESCPKLRWIGVFGTGYNVVDTQACKQHGILVANVPDYSTMAVAQHTTALLLEIASRVGEHNEAVHRELHENPLMYDKDGEQHYDIVSAMIKSIRGGDPNAAVYWMARMLQGGEDP
ncbi:MAG: hypothetical protein EGP89_00220, partial [Ruminococcaceae bacterium]|nr:hypothetical protein [Oscillospiraceae bacterium]